MTIAHRSLLLALETSGLAGGAALFSPDGLIGCASFTARKLHSQRLLPTVEWLLARTGVTMEHVGAVAVSCGPGSYTGLRVGMSAAKGLALGSGACLIGVPTLDALARRAAPDALPGELIVTMLDARSGEVFAAIHEAAAAGPPRRLCADMATHIPELAARLDRPAVIAGDGAMKHFDTFTSAAPNGARLAGPSRRVMSPEEVGLIGLEKWAEGSTDNPAALVPEYLRHGYAAPKSG